MNQLSPAPDTDALYLGDNTPDVTKVDLGESLRGMNTYLQADAIALEAFGITVEYPSYVGGMMNPQTGPDEAYVNLGEFYADGKAYGAVRENIVRTLVSPLGISAKDFDKVWLEALDLVDPAVATDFRAYDALNEWNLNRPTPEGIGETVKDMGARLRRAIKEYF